MNNRRLCLILLSFLVIIPFRVVRAQEELPPGPVYIVQSGDTLFSIAKSFRMPINDLIAYNQIQNPNLLNVGAKIVIPGYEGVDGVLETYQVAFGETIHKLSEKFNISEQELVRLNHLTSPSEVYAGYSLIIPVNNEVKDVPSESKTILEKGETLLEVGLKAGVDPWSLLSFNTLLSSESILPGDVLYFPSIENKLNSESFTPEVNYSLKEMPVIQGRTMVILISTPLTLNNIKGDFVGNELTFWNLDENSYVALQGVHAMLEPGIYPLNIKTTLVNGTEIDFTQSVYVQDGNYPFDPPLIVNSETVDYDVTTQEDEFWDSLFQPLTERIWEGKFRSPVADYLSHCWPSKFGNRRSFNGSPYIYFHTGLDFCGQVGNDIFAAAKGVVVYVGESTIHGNATIINHGWGVYTAYAHQSETLVNVGDIVKPGQLIGKVGSTGRVTGPHLHWEVWAGGVQVDPIEWLEKEFP
ncbi:MAG: peptidoglycan DD-metalloendopeptidase family protein [Anaerolineales bacterium]|nr:peptidoglycan DD-metalloendopeptidase family protein [Anaerolineales bacterium]